MTTIAVAPDKFACGIVDCSDVGTFLDKDGQELSSSHLAYYEQLELEDALLRSYETDAHLVAYVVEGLERQPRINKPGLPKYDRRVTVRCFFVDVDNPEHADWTDESRAAARAQEANTELLQTCGVYDTAHGRRFVQPLSIPLLASEAEPYLQRWLDELVSAGVDVDPACKDWTRHFRLPNVMRDGELYVSPYINLQRMRPIELAPLPAPTPRPRPTPLAASDVSNRYGQAALDSALKAITGASEGTRNATLFKEAAALYELVAGGKSGLYDSQATDCLADAARRSGLTERETAATLEQARRGMKNPRVPPERPVREQPPTQTDDDAPHELEADWQPIPLKVNGHKPIVIPSTSEWPEPEPLETEMLPVPKLDPELLPEVLRPWLLDEANRLQTPLDFVAVPAIVALGSIIGRQMAIRPLAKDNWSEYPNLWGMLIGTPSEKKTPAMNAALSPLDRLAATAINDYQGKLEGYTKELASAKARAKGIERAIVRAAEHGEDTSSLSAQVQPLPEPPPCRRYKVTDCTPEKLADLLLKNPNGLLLSVDELAGWLHGMQREGHEQERGFFLTGWSGKASYDVDRISRGSLHIPAVCLSVMGTIQPHVWADYVRDALGVSEGADGFMQRFQLAVWPDAQRSSRIVDQWPDKEAKHRIAVIFENLTSIGPEAAGAKQSEYDDTPYLRFAPEVQAIAKDFLRKYREYWNGSTDHPALVAHAVKMQKTWAALALIFHLVEWAAGGAPGGVGASALEKAVGWIEYLELHARRIYGCALREDRTLLQILAGKIKAGTLESGFTVRDVCRKHWAGVNDADEIKASLAHLSEAGWIRTRHIKHAGAGRPADGWVINPVFLGKVTQSDVNDEITPISSFLAPAVARRSDEISS